MIDPSIPEKDEYRCRFDSETHDDLLRSKTFEEKKPRFANTYLSYCRSSSRLQEIPSKRFKSEIVKLLHGR